MQSKGAGPLTQGSLHLWEQRVLDEVQKPNAFCDLLQPAPGHSAQHPALPGGSQQLLT